MAAAPAAASIEPAALAGACYAAGAWRELTRETLLAALLLLQAWVSGLPASP
jgi:hypothetical protein